MTTALTGLQASVTAIDLNITPSSPSYDDFLFIDPVTSTKSQAVYRNGPELNYDPVKGGVTIIAPPMLGPADEFGNRDAYMARSLTIYTSDFMADNPTFPEITVYRRNVQRLILFSSTPQESDLSFLSTEKNSYDLDIDDSEISIFIANNNDLSGAKIHFPVLLKPGITADFFNSISGPSPGNNIWPNPNYNSDPSEVPDVYFSIHYRSVAYYNSHNLLAVPVSIPEPANMLPALMACSMISTRRWSQRAK